MAPFGKLYTYEVSCLLVCRRSLPLDCCSTVLIVLLTCSSLQGNTRSVAICAVAKANNVELEIVHTKPSEGVSSEYLGINKLGKIPTFIGSDGYKLHEAIAIAIYSKSNLPRQPTCAMMKKPKSVIPV